MKNTRTQTRPSHVTHLLALAAALTWFTAPPTHAAEGGAAAAKPAPRIQPTAAGTNLEWKVSADFHDIDFDNLPLGEVAKELQTLSKDQFDVVIPSSVPPEIIDPNTSVPVEALIPREIPIRLRFRNVTVQEVFEAMNMLFEMDRTPVRWELLMFSSRPVAVLRPVEIRRPSSPPSPPPPSTPKAQTPATAPSPVQRVVLYVGSLVGNPAGDAKPGGMTLDALLKTLTETLEETFSPPRAKLQCHSAAELLIVTGPAEEVSFVTEVLEALKQKVVADHGRKAGTAADDSKAFGPRQRF